MKEIKFDKYTPFRWYAWVLLLLTIFWFAGDAKADDTGYVNLSAYFTKQFEPGGMQVEVGYKFNLTEFGFYNAGYQSLYFWRYRAGVGYPATSFLTSSKDTNTTTFQIVQGGTGSGIVSYIDYPALGVDMYWNCNGVCTITSSKFYVTYGHQTGWLSDFTSTNTPYRGTGGWGYLDADNPIGMGSTVAPALTYPVTGRYESSQAFQASTYYNFSYPINNTFVAQIDKDSLISTRINIHSINNNSQYYISGMDTTDFQTSNTTKDQIWMNVSTTGGNYTDVIINSTYGTGFSAPVPNTPNIGGQYNPALTIPSSGGLIQFNQTRYIEGDTARVEWAISDDGWNGILNQYLGDTWYWILDRDGNELYFDASRFGNRNYISAQEGNFSFRANKVGTYTLKLYTTNAISQTLYDSAVMTVVPVSPAYLALPESAISGQNISINYGFGNTYGAVNEGYILDYTLDEFGVADPATTRYINLSCPCTTGAISTIFNSVGSHRISLFDQTHIRTVATANIRVIAQDSVLPFTSITSNSLTTDANQYNQNDIILGNYAVSSTNYSNYSYFKILLISSSGITSNFLTVNNQYGSYELPVLNGAFQMSQSGSAFVNLTAQSSVFNGTPIILASVPITINANASGYSVAAQPQEICKTQNVYVKYAAPGGRGMLRTTYLTPALTTKYQYLNFTQNGTKTFSFSDGSVADKSAIQFEVYDNVSNYQVGVIVKYKKSGCSIEPTPTPMPIKQGEDWGNASQVNSKSYTAAKIDAYVGTMGYGVNNNTRFMFAVIIIVVFIIIGAMSTKNETVAVSMGFLPFAFFSAISLESEARNAGIEFIPKWVMIIFILLLALSFKILR